MDFEFMAQERAEAAREEHSDAKWAIAQQERIVKHSCCGAYGLPGAHTCEKPRHGGDE